MEKVRRTQRARRETSGSLSDRVRSLRLGDRETPAVLRRSASCRGWCRCPVADHDPRSVTGPIASGVLHPARHHRGIRAQSERPRIAEHQLRPPSAKWCCSPRATSSPHQVQVSPKVGGMLLELNELRGGPVLRGGEHPGPARERRLPGGVRSGRAVAKRPPKQRWPKSRTHSPEEIEQAEAELKETRQPCQHGSNWTATAARRLAAHGAVAQGLRAGPVTSRGAWSAASSRVCEFSLP